MVKKYYHNPIDMLALGRDLKWTKDKIVEVREGALSCNFTGRRDKCPICGSSRIKPYLKIHNFDYYLCEDCNHMFYIQILSSEAIEKLYAQESNYLDMYLDDKYYEERLKRIAIPRVNFVSNALFNNDQEKIRSSSWLDIGGGGGQILVAAKRAGYKVTGVEPGSKIQEIGKKYDIKIHNAFITPENVEEFVSGFNIISLFGVIEHMEDPVGIIKTISDAIPPSTYVIILVPRHPCWLLFSVMNLPDMTSVNFVPPHHIHIFSDRSAELMFKMCGLEVEGIQYLGKDFFEMINTLLVFSGRELSSFPPEFAASVNNIQKAMDESEMSESMVMIARKM